MLPMMFAGRNLRRRVKRIWRRGAYIGIAAAMAAGRYPLAQEGHPLPPPPPAGIRSPRCANRPVPQLEDVTAKAGITFRHISSAEKRYIVESMGGGVMIVDYDRDGWPDIYFTNSPTVDMALHGEPAIGALYHNNH